MTRLIDAEALKKAIEEVEDNYDGYEPNDLGKFMYKVGDLIDNTPTVESEQDFKSEIIRMVNMGVYPEAIIEWVREQM